MGRQGESGEAVRLLRGAVCFPALRMRLSRAVPFLLSVAEPGEQYVWELKNACAGMA